MPAAVIRGVHINYEVVGSRGPWIAERRRLQMINDKLQVNNDRVARWLLGDNAAEGTVRLLVLILAYVVISVLVLDWLIC